MLEILERYEVSMSQEAYYQLSMATLMMSRGNTDEAISLLNRIDMSTKSLKYIVRNKLIRAYSMHYDQVDFCLDEIQKFKKWIRNNRQLMSDRVEIGLIRSMSILTDILKRKPVDGILLRIREDQPLSGRMWFLKEVKKRYHVDTSFPKRS